MEKTEKLIFKLSEVKTDEFATFPENLKQNESKDEVHLRVQYSYGVPDNAKKFMVSLKFNFSLNDKSIIVIKGSCFFDINELEWNHLKNGNSITFPRKQVISMTAITIGAIRGILHAKTESTPFNKYFIPQTDLSNMIDGGIELSLDFNNKNED